MQNQSVIRGTSYLLLAQVSFLVTGYILQIGLGRVFGPALYGIYSVVVTVATVFNLFLISGIPQATSKFVAEDPSQKDVVLRTSLLLSIVFSLIISGFIFFGAEYIAGFLNDLTLIPYIRIVAVMVISYGPFTIITAYFNGVKNYRIQSILLGTYNLLKLLIIFILIFCGFSVGGAALGFAVSPVIPLIAGLYLIGFSILIGSNTYPVSKIIRFAVPIIIFSAAVNLVLSLDLFFVKAILIDNTLAGCYAAASTIARIPYLLMWAVTAALFPAISACPGDKEKVRNYIRESIRYTLIILLPITAMIASTAPSLVSLFYSSGYIAAADPLEILVFGLCLFGIFALLTTIISGCNNPFIAMIMSILVLIIDIVLNIILVPGYGISGAALATTIASIFGVIIAAAYVFYVYGTLMPVHSAIKIIVSSVFVYFTLIFFIPDGLWVIPGYVLTLSVYAGLLYGMGEIQKKDIDRLKQLLPAK